MLAVPTPDLGSLFCGVGPPAPPAQSCGHAPRQYCPLNQHHGQHHQAFRGIPGNLVSPAQRKRPLCVVAPLPLGQRDVDGKHSTKLVLEEDF